MTIHSTDNDDGNSFEYRLREVSDDEIINILRFREHYQPHAVKAAIREALRRGIISSVDDLEKDEFKAQPLPPKSIFPLSSVETQNTAIFKSLCRTNYLYSVIPIVFGAFNLYNQTYVSGATSCLVGALMAFFTFKLDKERKTVYAQLLLFINLASVAFALYYVSMGTPNQIDIIFGAIIGLLIVYTTAYLYRMSIYFSKKGGR